jgi:hypothetical protein
MWKISAPHRDEIPRPSSPQPVAIPTALPGLQRYSSTLSLTSVLDGLGGQRHAPAALYPQERPGTHCTGGWVGPRAGLDRYGKSRPHQDSIPGPSSPQPVAIPTALPAPHRSPELPIKTFCLFFFFYVFHN